VWVLALLQKVISWYRNTLYLENTALECSGAHGTLNLSMCSIPRGQAPLVLSNVTSITIWTIYSCSYSRASNNEKQYSHYAIGLGFCTSHTQNETDCSYHKKTKQFPFRTGNQPLLKLQLLFHHKTATNNTFMGGGGTNVAQQTGNRNVQLDVAVHCKTVTRSCITGTH